MVLCKPWQQVIVFNSFLHLLLSFCIVPDLPSPVSGSLPLHPRFFLIVLCPCYTFLFISYTILLLGWCQAAWCLPLVACSLLLVAPGSQSQVTPVLPASDQAGWEFLASTSPSVKLDPRSIALGKTVLVRSQWIRAQAGAINTRLNPKGLQKPRRREFRYASLLFYYACNRDLCYRVYIPSISVIPNTI